MLGLVPDGANMRVGGIGVGNGPDADASEADPSVWRQMLAGGSSGRLLPFALALLAFGPLRDGDVVVGGILNRIAVIVAKEPTRSDGSEHDTLDAEWFAHGFR